VNRLARNTSSGVAPVHRALCNGVRQWRRRQQRRPRREGSFRFELRRLQRDRV